jgi:sulfite exporter TauE/SafE
MIVALKYVAVFSESGKSTALEGSLEHQHGHFEHLLHTMDAFDAATIMSIAWFSFLMSWHCAAMCGPLVCARLAPGKAKLWRSVALYNFGRVLSYAIMGAVVGALVGSLADAAKEFFPLIGVTLAIVFAVILALHGCFLIAGRELTWMPAALGRFAAGFANVMNRNFSEPVREFGLGAIAVFLPCMTLSSALAAAAMTGDAVRGSLVMVGFVAGTLPVMVMAPVLSANMSGYLSNRISLSLARRAGGVLLLVASAITVLRVFH